jgi:hypothetical protein
MPGAYHRVEHLNGWKLESLAREKHSGSLGTWIDYGLDLVFNFAAIIYKNDQRC